MTFRSFDAATDMERCGDIFMRAWNQALPLRQRDHPSKVLQGELEEEQVIVAVDGGTVLGFAAVWRPGAYLHHLYVDPERHGCGVGTLLLRQARVICSGEQLSLKCLIENEGALGFYRFHGFREDGETGTDPWGSWVGLRDEHEPDQKLQTLP